MRLHTNSLEWSDLYKALNSAKGKGLVASHIEFVTSSSHGSRTHNRAFEIQLGTDTKISGDKRRYKNSGQYGASNVYAATYDEWGWFIKELFTLDNELSFGHYKSFDDFNRMTENKYV
jgi:hypothetical protein